MTQSLIRLARLCKTVFWYILAHLFFVLVDTVDELVKAGLIKRRSRMAVALAQVALFSQRHLERKFSQIIASRKGKLSS